MGHRHSKDEMLAAAADVARAAGEADGVASVRVGEAE
jgi:hypothetical protein